MRGIDLNNPVRYIHASLRYFEAGEHHVDRVCPDDVLLLVFDGVLRFTEDGAACEVAAGEYHIQRQGSVQKGAVASDAPKYLYIHFSGVWGEQGSILPFQGCFDPSRLMPLMEEMDGAAHGPYTLTERTAVFLEILSALIPKPAPESKADEIAAFLTKKLSEDVSLDILSNEFHFSKNHIINLFKRAYGTTPTDYLNSRRLHAAKHLLEATSRSAEDISLACGFRSYSHFYRLFLRKNGISPSKWREQKRLRP